MLEVNPFFISAHSCLTHTPYLMHTFLSAVVLAGIRILQWIMIRSFYSVSLMTFSCQLKYPSNTKSVWNTLLLSVTQRSHIFFTPSDMIGGLPWTFLSNGAHSVTKGDPWSERTFSSRALRWPYESGALILILGVLHFSWTSIGIAKHDLQQDI